LGAINGQSLIGMSLNQVVSVIVANPQRPLKVLFLVRPQEVAPLAPLVPVPVRTKAEAKALVAADKVAARQAKVDAKARVAAEKLIARQKKAKAKVLEAARKANARQAKQARKPVRTIKVTGTSFRASSVHGAMAAHGEVLAHNRFTTAHRVRLRREPNNLYDRNAVAVDVSGHHVGYIPKTQVRGVVEDASTNSSIVIRGYSEVKGGGGVFIHHCIFMTDISLFCVHSRNCTLVGNLCT
jgi:hypothetical protein